MGLKMQIQTKRGAGTRRKVFAPVLVTLMLAAVALGANATAAMALSPAVETSATPSVAEKGATLKGTVNPGGAETKAYFEYGTTTSYGSKTAEVSLGSGTATLEHSQAISGLSPNTVYHYRIVASNAFGSSQGIDQTFTTVGPPEVFTWFGEPHESGEGGALKAWIDANGQSTTYQFEYGTKSGSYTNTTPVESAGSESSGKFFTSTITGLMPGTKVFYRVIATNAGGKVTGNENYLLSSKSPGVEYTPVSAISRTGATLNADIEPRESTKYYFEYGTTTAYGTKTTLKEIGFEPEVISVSQAISGLKANTLYHYRLVAENPSGTTVGTDQTFTTLAAATLSKGGTQLLVGAPLKAFSTNLTFSGESGSHSCTEAELSGTVKENPGAVQGVSTLKMQSGEGVGCAWKPTFSIKYSTPTSGITIEYAKNGAGEGFAQSSKFVLLQTVYYEKSFKMAECEYNLVLAGTFKTATALEPTLSGNTETVKGGVYCPPPETVSGKFAVTTGGAAVEAK